MALPLVTKKEIAILLLLPISAMAISFIIDANFTVAMLLFMGIPALWLITRLEQIIIKNVTLYTMLVWAPLSVIVEYIAEINGSWVITDSLFSFRLFNVVEIDVVVWGFLFGYLALLFYEYTSRQYRAVNWKALIWGIALIVLYFIVFAVVKTTQPRLLIITYFYVWMIAGGMILPLCYMLITKPTFLLTVLPVTLYAFFVSMLYEYTALSLGHWTFPGTFVAMVPFFGYTIPLEEFLWFIFAAPAAVVWYSWFSKETKKYS